MIERQLQEQIEKHLGSDKAIIIIGARQVGKSTLLNSIFSNMENVMWLNGDDADVQELFRNMTAARMKAFLGKKKFLVVDEAQRIPDIGLRLKLVTDQIPGVQVFATGSSSFQLSSKVNESLTGRKREFQMFPLSFKEMVNNTDLLTEMRMLPHRLIYGYYPEIVTAVGDEKEVLRELSTSYLYKDILQMDGIAKPDKLVKLLQALAYQIGSQVSYREIGQLIDLDPKTVEKYIDIFEKSYIIFRLGSFSRNLRNELKSSRKIYFYDLGIRNAVIADFRPIEMRNDKGALWENFAIAERMKKISYDREFRNVWFWRTTQQKEIDLIEEADGELTAFEFKWNNEKGKVKMPSQFEAAYRDVKFSVITPANIDQFLL
jgi:predicted AAA+ superfamily ATPase